MKWNTYTTYSLLLRSQLIYRWLSMSTTLVQSVSATIGRLAVANKHIDLRNHYIHELVEQGIIEAKFVRSEDNTSDIFTKNLCQILFEKHQTTLGVGPPKCEKVGVRA
jgi:hypothetical protein